MRPARRRASVAAQAKLQHLGESSDDGYDSAGSYASSSAPAKRRRGGSLKRRGMAALEEHELPRTIGVPSGMSKEEARRIRNRESAARSRARQRKDRTGLEKRVDQLEAQVRALKAENARLRARAAAAPLAPAPPLPVAAAAETSGKLPAEKTMRPPVAPTPGAGSPLHSAAAPPNSLFYAAPTAAPLPAPVTVTTLAYTTSEEEDDDAGSAAASSYYNGGADDDMVGGTHSVSGDDIASTAFSVEDARDLEAALRPELATVAEAPSGSGVPASSSASPSTPTPGAGAAAAGAGSAGAGSADHAHNVFSSSELLQHALQELFQISGNRDTSGTFAPSTPAAVSTAAQAVSASAASVFPTMSPLNSASLGDAASQAADGARSASSGAPDTCSTGSGSSPSCHYPRKPAALAIISLYSISLLPWGEMTRSGVNPQSTGFWKMFSSEAFRTGMQRASLALPESQRASLAVAMAAIRALVQERLRRGVFRRGVARVVARDSGGAVSVGGVGDGARGIGVAAVVDAVDSDRVVAPTEAQRSSYMRMHTVLSEDHAGIVRRQPEAAMPAMVSPPGA